MGKQAIRKKSRTAHFYVICIRQCPDLLRNYLTSNGLYWRAMKQVLLKSLLKSYMHTNKLTQMHTDLQVTSKRSLWQTFLGISSLAQKSVLGENLGARIEFTAFSLTTSYILLLIIICPVRNNLIPQIWQIRFFCCFGYWASPFFKKLPQLLQICQFSRIRIHGQTQSPLPKCLSSLLVNLGQFCGKKSDVLPLGIKAPVRLSNFWFFYVHYSTLPPVGKFF